MLLFLLAYLGGVLTIVSPCILPVLPFVFARSATGFRRGTLPLLLGMVLTFALVATLASLGGELAGRVNQGGRWVALVLVAIFGFALLFPSLSDRLTQPLVRLGDRLNSRAAAGGGSVASSLLLGVATGLLWAPCAGPILGIILTGAALNGASVATTVLLGAYALGAATSLAAALLLGDRVFRAMKGRIGSFERLRQVAGVLVIASVVAIAAGLDTRVLAKVASGQTSAIEGGLGRLLGVDTPGTSSPEAARKDGKLVLGVEGQLPSFEGTGPWFNSRPLTREQLKGKVVLIDFWTYSCINCLRALPYVRAWHERYAKDGLVVIGVHAPEFAFERDPANVAKAIRDNDVPYPVVLDNQYKLWRAFNNRYWPAHYFIDAQGRVRAHHFGEGGYAESEEIIRTLLAEANRPVEGGKAVVRASGAQAAAQANGIGSPETYLGYARADRFVSPGGLVHDKVATYAPATSAARNDWSLEGRWLVSKESARNLGAGGAIRFRFAARDLHLVLGSTTGKPVRFRVLLNGKAPGKAAGMDVAADGTGTVTGQRLYQLIRQPTSAEGDFRIEFLDPGVEAFAFTFG